MSDQNALGFPSFLHFLETNKTDNKLRLHIYNSGKKVDSLSYQSIFETARRRAAAIRKTVTLDQKFILLEGCNDAHFVINFFAVQLAGLTPVPVPTNLWVAEDRYLEIIASIADTCKSNLMIAGKHAALVVAQDKKLSANLSVLESEKLAQQGDLIRSEDAPMNLPDSEDIAYLQFSSGSTGRPKGVVITHRNVVANSTQIKNHMEVDADKDVNICWLPVHHDMGLMAGMLVALHSGVDSYLMNPFDFAVNPNRWLKMVSDLRGSIITGPNSAFHMAAKKAKRKQIEKLNLESVRIAMVAAEPINSATLDTFYETFKSAGFKKEAYLPAYGLAENTLAVTMYSITDQIIVDRINVDSFLRQGRAIPCIEDTAMQLVACGEILPGIDLRIVDEQGNSLPDRQIGEIHIKCTATTSGYYDRDDLNKELFADEMLRTGDLGYMADGQLYVTGRKKDVIIINGQNINAEEIENYTARMKDVRAGRLVAFAIKNRETGSEQIHLMIETKPETRYLDFRLRDALKKKISAHTSHFIAVQPEQISLVAPGTIRKTTSGKVRRAEMKSLYEQDLIHEGPIGFAYDYAQNKLMEWQAAAKLMVDKYNPFSVLPFGSASDK